MAYNKVTKFLVLAVTLLVCLSWAQLAKADDIQTIGPFSGPVYCLSINTTPCGGVVSTFPQTVNIGTFIMDAGDTAATISGTTGLLSPPANGTAPETLYLGTIALFTCSSIDPCFSVNGTSWSHTFTAGELATLGTGSAAFTASQTAPFAVELGTTTLDQVVPTTQAVPEPSTFSLLASGFLVLGLALRKLV